MWDRKELKAKGKAAYRANRITCIIAALLLMIVTGAGTVGTAGSSWNNIHKNMNNSSVSQDIDGMFDDIDESGDGFYEDQTDTDLGEPSKGKAWLTPVIIAAVAVIILIALAFGLALGAFLFNPALVGLQKFFIDNAAEPTTGLDRNNIGVAFNENYMKVVGSMFTTGLFNFLWCLLFIIPGIYKSYCWRLVPYIVSENPTITGKEARTRSSEMMRGNKWASFVLDLSFLGWKILGALTVNILNIIFTNPYQAATNAELYLTLSGRPSGMAAPAEVREEEAAEVVFELDQEGMND